MKTVIRFGGAEDAAVTLHDELTTIVREEIGLNENFASQFAARILAGLRKRMGGREVYIPSEDQTERDAAIRGEYNGRNVKELCQRYALSRSGLYRIVGR